VSQENKGEINPQDFQLVKDFLLPLEMTMRMFFSVSFCKNTAPAE